MGPNSRHPINFDAGNPIISAGLPILILSVYMGFACGQKVTLTLSSYKTAGVVSSTGMAKELYFT